MLSDVKKVLVLGSNSFTGSHLVNYILEKTGCEVAGLSRSPQYDPCFLPYAYRKPATDRFQFLQMDVARNTHGVLDFCDSFKPDLVFNFAAQGEVRNSWKWPEQWWETNCMSVVRLTEGLRQRDYLKRYVSISTPEVYGMTGENIKESHQYHPSTPYAAAKLGGDLHLFTMQKRYDFPVVFTRAANLYGIHQQLYRIIPRTVIYLKLGRKLDLHGRGLTRRAFIHARDVADATWKAALSGKNGEVYHLAPEGEERTIADTVEFICQELGHDFQSSVNMMDENFGQDGRFSLDAGKARAELGWKTSVSFEDGVRETVTWINENWDFIRKQPLDYVHIP